jgi:hypothetical protein
MTRTLFLNCSMLLLSCAHASAQSFRCEEAATVLQRSICASAELSSDQTEPEGGNADAPTCQIAAQRLSRLTGDFADRSPLNSLTRTTGSGISAGGKIVELDGGTTDLLAWAAAQTPPVEQAETLGDVALHGESAWLEQLPGTAFYAIHQVGGSAHCYTSSYFEVDRHGHARSAEGPALAMDGSCMVDRSFGTIDGAPAMFEEHYTRGPEMRSTLKIATRKRDRSWTVCRLRFEYEPLFSDRTLNRWNSSCTGAHCARLREAAFRIASAVQDDPQRARQQLMAALSETQRTDYDKAAEAARPQAPVISDQAADPARFTKEFPFRVPFADGERLYVVSVGHFTTGWQYFADWSVTFRAASQRGTTEEGSFAIGMWKGRILRTSIEAL